MQEGGYMDAEEVEQALKVVVVGDGGVGKSSLIRRYCRGVFTSQYKKTIGVDFLERVVTLGEGRQVRLMLWDTAGQEEFDCITKAYYRGAHCCLLSFSTTDRASFLHVKEWKKKVEKECGPVPMLLVMTKIDLLPSAATTRDEAEEMAASLGLILHTTSAKENLNIEPVFRSLAQALTPARQPRQLAGWRVVGQHQHRLRLQIERQTRDLKRKERQRREASLSSSRRDPSFSLNTDPSFPSRLQLSRRDARLASSFLTLAREDEEELEWWSEAGSLAGLSLTSPHNNMMPPLSLSRNDLLPIQGGREGFSLPPSSSLSSLSYLHSSFPSPTSHQNSSKFTTGAKSSSSTSTGTSSSLSHRPLSQSSPRLSPHSTDKLGSKGTRVSSLRGNSQLLLDTGFSTLGREAEDDFTTQFLHSPMFDSLREKNRSWGFRRGKYQMGGRQRPSRCILM